MRLRVVALASDTALQDQLHTEVDGLPDCLVVAVGTIDDEVIGGVPADVVLWDLGPDPSAARDQLARIGETDLPVLMLGPPGLGPEAIALGAAGYLRRDTRGPRLRAALAAAAVALQVSEPAGDAGGRAAASEDLTAREMDVLQLLAEGLPNKEIARRLRISEHTVKFHVTTVLGKLGARTRTEAVTRAVRQGLIIL